MDLVDSFECEWEILSVLHDDLQTPDFAAELLQQKASIEAITASAVPEPLPKFPELTKSYRDMLAAAVRGEAC